MENVRQYFLTILAVAILVAIVTNLFGNSKSRNIVKLLTALVMAVAVLSPLSEFRLTPYLSQFESVNDVAHVRVKNGEVLYNEYLAGSIKERCESYICDKAVELGVKLTVHIECDTSDLPIPVYAELRGDVSPYVREKIQHMIVCDIGIPEEQQTWI